MRFAAAVKTIHGDPILAERAPAAVVVADLNLDWSCVRAGVMQVALHRNFVAAAHQATSRNFNRFHRNEGKKHVSAKSYRNEQNNDRAFAHPSVLQFGKLTRQAKSGSPSTRGRG